MHSASQEDADFRENVAHLTVLALYHMHDSTVWEEPEMRTCRILVENFSFVGRFFSPLSLSHLHLPPPLLLLLLLLGSPSEIQEFSLS